YRSGDCASLVRQLACGAFVRLAKGGRGLSILPTAIAQARWPVATLLGNVRRSNPESTLPTPATTTHENRQRTSVWTGGHAVPDGGRQFDGAGRHRSNNGLGAAQ